MLSTEQSINSAISYLKKHHWKVEFPSITTFTYLYMYETKHSRPEDLIILEKKNIFTIWLQKLLNPPINKFILPIVEDFNEPNNNEGIEKQPDGHI